MLIKNLIRFFSTLSFFLLINFSVSAGISDNDRSKTIECTGIYYANSMIPQGELELEKIVHSFAAKKFLSAYLIKEGVEEEKLKNRPENWRLACQTLIKSSSVILTKPQSPPSNLEELKRISENKKLPR